MKPLASPEQTEQLVDALVHDASATGQTTLRIPVPDRSTVHGFLALVGQPLGQAQK